MKNLLIKVYVLVSYKGANLEDYLVGGKERVLELNGTGDWDKR